MGASIWSLVIQMSPQGMAGNEGVPEPHSKATFPWAHVKVSSSYSLLCRPSLQGSWPHMALASCPWWSTKRAKTFLDITVDSRWADSDSLSPAALGDKCHSWAPAPAKWHGEPHTANPRAFSPSRLS